MIHYLKAGISEMTLQYSAISSKCIFYIRHEAGVCSIMDHPSQSNILATGSYDEKIRIWDKRSLIKPLSSHDTGGGVWRLKWHPIDHSRLLAACMYNGFHIFNVNMANYEVTHEQSFMEHASIAYGADWHGYKDLIGTCSFYDHMFCIWSPNKKAF
jgi:diphthamide biosynthesis protein 7